MRGSNETTSSSYKAGPLNGLCRVFPILKKITNNVNWLQLLPAQLNSSDKTSVTDLTGEPWNSEIGTDQFR